jgi:FAD/FMN-containing dehydrogenase
MKLPRVGRVSRRSFLVGTAAAAAGVAAGGLLGFVRGRSLRDPEFSIPGDRAWRQLQGLLPGRLLRPGDADYMRVARPSNLRYEGILPQGIARCRSPGDVAAAIRWCRDWDMPFAIRTGGHSYAGHSTTYGLMLDVSPMSTAAFERSTGLLTVAGGARNSDVYAILAANNAAVTHGRCSSVGVAGFLLGGGVGFNMRRKGLGCDQLVRTELVMADGSRQQADAANNPDLFWASRGGAGGNFGVSTSFTLQTFPAEPLTVFKLRWTSKPEAVTEALMAALLAAPDSLGVRFSLGAVTPDQLRQGRDVPVHLMGQLAGSKKDLLDILSSVYRIAEPDRAEIQEVSYWDGQKFLNEPGGSTYYQERSVFVDKPFGSEALAESFRWLRSWPGTSQYSDLRFFHTGSAVNALAPDATAFVHRKSQWLMLVGLTWNAQDHTSAEMMRKAHDWQNGFYQAMLPFAGGGAYQNFPDPSLVDWRRAYYGGNLDRLARIKAAIDPTNVLRFAQSV